MRKIGSDYHGQSNGQWVKAAVSVWFVERIDGKEDVYFTIVSSIIFNI